MSLCFRFAAKSIVVAAVTLLWCLGSMLAAQPAAAMSLAQANGKTGIKIGQLDPLKALFNKVPVGKLTELSLTNVKADAKSLTGDVTFAGRPWTFIATHGGSLKNTFVAFGPKANFKFKDLYGNARGVAMLDTLQFSGQMLLAAGAGMALKSTGIPARIRPLVGRFFEKPKSYTLALPIGVTMFASLDMAKTKYLADSLAFLGAKSTKVQLKGALAVNVLDRLVTKQRPLPSIQLEGALPTFRPKLAGKLQLPADVRLVFKAKLTKVNSSVGFAGTTTVAVGKQKLNVVLENAVTMETGKPPVVGTAMTLAKGEAWKQAFGLKWLTIKDYTMSFKTDNASTIGVGFGGVTTIGSKTVHVGGSQNMTTALVVPTSLQLEINDGPNKVGEIGLADMVSVFNAMLKADGSKLQVPLDKMPDVALAGVKKGEGPRVYLRVKPTGALGVGAASGVGFEMAGKLRFFGSDIATVDKASISPAMGIDVRTRVANIAIGPFKLPSAIAQLVVKADTKAPRLILAVNDFSVLGSKNTLQFSTFVTHTSLVSKNDFGDLLKFNLSAVAGTKGINRLDDLKKADFRLRASLQSDPGKWLTDRGKDAVNAILKQVQPELQKAKQELARKRQEVEKTSRLINTIRAKVKRERQPGINRLKAAEAEIRKLDAEIKSLNGQIRTHRGRIRSCTQTMNVCYSWRVTGGHCTAKRSWWPYPCYRWAPLRSSCSASKSVADPGARATCEATNVKPRADLAWAESRRGSVVAAKATTTATLIGLRKGITNLPVDLDPRVAALIAANETVRLALDAQVLATQGMDQLAALVREGVKSIEAPDNFVIKKSQLLGSLNKGLQGVPVVLDLNYISKGKPYQARLGVSLKDKAFNEKQLKVLAMGLAIRAILTKAASLKVIPHSVLENVTRAYLTRQAEVDEVLRKAIALHGGIADKDVKDSQDHANSLTAEIGAQRDQAEAARQRQIAARARIRGIVLKNRFKQLASAPKSDPVGTTKSVTQSADFIFGVEPDGDLKFYEYERGKTWRQGDIKIGNGWTGQFGRKIFAGGPGEIYGIQPDGALLYYRYDLKAGKWAVGGKKIGTGWQDFHHVFAAEDGNVYAIRKNGDLMAYKHDGNGRWLYASKKIGTGWHEFRHVFGGGGGVIYAINKHGHLLYYRHGPDHHWLIISQRFGDGWQVVGTAFSTGGGRIFATKPDGALYRYQHDAALNWPVANDKLGTGWTGQFGPMVMGSIEPGALPATKFNPRHGWDRMPGAAIDAGAGPEGHLWMVSTDKAAYEWTGNKWSKAAGTPPLMRIAVAGHHEVWAIAEDMSIWRTRNSRWQKMPGLARDVGVGPDGRVMVVGSDRNPYAWDGKKWNRQPGSGQDSISVGANGTYWIVNVSNIIWRWDGSRWIHVKGNKARDVAVGPGGRVYITGTDGRGYTWAGGNNWTLNPPSGGQARVAALPEGPVVINTGQQIWRVK